MITVRLGFVLLGIWLILTGLFTILSLSFQGAGILMAILAIVSGALILWGK